MRVWFDIELVAPPRKRTYIRYTGGHNVSGRATRYKPPTVASLEGLTL